MTIRAFFKLFICVSLRCAFAGQSTAQTPPEDAPKVLRVQYNTVYQLQDSYTIIYDNTAEAAKLKEFQVTFYGPGRKALAQTQTETHPLTGKTETYLLDAPIIGFNEVELSILTLHSGELDAFPTAIGAILALNELTEVPKAEPELDVKPEVTPKPAPPATPKFTPQETERLVDTNSKISQLLSALKTLSDKFAVAKEFRKTDTEKLNQFITKTNTLFRQTDAALHPGLKSQIAALNSNMVSANTAASLIESQVKLKALQAEADALKKAILLLQNIRNTEGVEPSTVLPSLTSAEARLYALETAIAAFELPPAMHPSQMEGFEAQYLSLKSQIETPPKSTSNWPRLIVAALSVLVVLTFVAKAMLASTVQTRPRKLNLNRTETPGVIFPASPMLAGNVAGPLSPAGQLTASQLQMLSGPYAVLREAYQATGRIGYAQAGVPNSEDYSFGTGFLISDRHVVTNRHVHGLYGHYLLDETDPGGIEFIAEKDKNASDFVPFNSTPPLLLPGLDIAIYTLARAVTNRTPLQLKPIDTKDLHPRDVVVIGYPDTHTPEKAEILAVVEDNPVFAVKRISQGQIFRHSTDTDASIGVETSVSISKFSKFLMPAICHNASTLGGNSGSPVLDIKDGRLVGVHFAGFKAFNNEEAANLAMAISQLTQSRELENISNVTAITTEIEKQS